MRHVPLNEYLSTKSNWPARLLGWQSYSLTRDEMAVAREYDRDRYEPLLRLTLDRPEDYKIREFADLGMHMDEPMFISMGEEVFCTTVRTARMLWYSLIQSYVERFASGAVCELGCGYGFNLTYLGRNAYGGESSANAVALGKRLGLDVSPFNYNHAADYEVIRLGSTVLTVHSIEQIPSALPIVEHLRQHRHSIKEVINLEPCWVDERSSWIGMTRNRYNQLVDHNHDLVDAVRRADDVEVVHYEADVFGLHPLNSTNIIVWRFKD